MQCQIEYHGPENFDFYLYEVNDYHTTDLVFYDASSDFYNGSFTPHLDTAQNGTDDWNLIHEKSINSCEKTYCKFTCALYRPLRSLDEKDLQFSNNEEVSVKSGYTVWTDRNT